jgi:hypothetical protein
MPHSAPMTHPSGNARGTARYAMTPKSSMAGLPRTHRSSRASLTDIGSPVSTTERQNE